MFRGRVRHVHFIGIGGIGMSGLAEILRTMDLLKSDIDIKKYADLSIIDEAGKRLK